ncbi:signal peptidase II [bacterium]|nr:signal peptidase II [bacterium]
MIIFFSAISIFLIDQIIKFYILKHLYLGQEISIIKNIFSISFVTNKGIAFGLFSNSNFPFILISIAVLVCMTLVFISFNKDAISKRARVWTRIAYGLILGGAFSNMLDRIRIGEVIDFLDFHIWPVFNIGDSAICVGAGIFVLNILKHKTQNKKDIK